MMDKMRYLGHLFVLNTFILLILSVWSRNLITLDYRDNGHKYLVQIRIKRVEKNTHCSGSILSESWVLSAAHCFKHDDLLGASLLRHMNQKYKTELNIPLEDIITHPKYNGAHNYTIKDAKNDLALLRTKFHYTDVVEPIKLSTYKVENEIASVEGYGLRNVPWEGQALVSYWDGETLCSYAWGSMTRFQKGDSGGPLSVKGELIGVVSGEHRKHHKKRPTMHTQCYADVASNMDWIQSVMEGSIKDAVS